MFNCFGFTFLNILERNVSNCFTNSGRMCSSLSDCSFCTTGERRGWGTNLQIFFLFNRADQSDAVAVFEEVFHEAADAVAVLDFVAVALLRLQRVLEVFAGRDRIRIGIEQL